MENSSPGAEEERQKIGQPTINSDEVITAHVAESRRLNSLAGIHRLPVELLTYILLLTSTATNTKSHPYLSFTWVCYHWRLVLIENPAFWTLVQPPVRFLHNGNLHVKTFAHELLRRSKSAKLDVILPDYSHHLSMLADLFANQSDRIRSLSLGCNEVSTQLFLSGKQFSSLRGLAIIDTYLANVGGMNRTFIRILPTLRALDHLETLDCTVWEGTPMNQLAVIFSRIRNLSVVMPTHAISDVVLRLLHNSSTLKKLRLIKHDIYQRHIYGYATLPELECLSVDRASIMKHIRAPKLNSLDADWGKENIMSVRPDHYPILRDDFDFSSIKYLYLRGTQAWSVAIPFCMLGSKERICCDSVFTMKTNILYAAEVDSTRHDCFHIRFGDWEENFVRVLSSSSSLIFSRLANLIELHLSISWSLILSHRILDEFPSVEKVIIHRGGNLPEFLHHLSDPTFCPRLNHLSFTTLELPESLEEHANEVGKSLTNCLQLRRQSSSVSVLKHITLINCPPLPVSWLEEIRGLGTEVVTEELE